MENDTNYHIMGQDNRIIKFVIPIGSNKKWWQFWKKDDKQTVEKILSFREAIKKNIEKRY